MPSPANRSRAPPGFFLGSHRPAWLRRTALPLFLSDRTLRHYRTLPVARGPWALDSGAFTELLQHGTWAHGPTPQEYAARAGRYQRDIGKLCWAAPQDWMCEPFILERTGLTVEAHQQRTLQNFLDLQALAPALPFIPVLQGWEVEDYVRCVGLYQQAGVQLAQRPVVGLGSVCRRQGTRIVEAIVRAVVAAVPGIRLHGFGVKATGLARYGHLLHSADSMAWSRAARFEPPLAGCTGHVRCSNCWRYAMKWRKSVVDQGFERPELS